MKVYKYENYDHYVQEQTSANERKIKWKWVQEDTISEIHQLQPVAYKILCHGTRNAAEQKYFKKYYEEAEIIGSEISHTASDFPMTVQHDFHEVKEEWVGQFDIVYSNSFDHSYDPEKCIITWKDQLSENGFMYIEHGYAEDINVCKSSDPLQISPEELLELFDKVGLEYKSDFHNDKKVSRIYQLHKRV
jgi:hypothetical protein